MDERLKRRLVGGLLLIGVAWVLAALLPPPAPPGARQGETVVFDLRQPDAPPLTPTPTSPPEIEPVAPVEDDSEAGKDSGEQSASNGFAGRLVLAGHRVPGKVC